MDKNVAKLDCHVLADSIVSKTIDLLFIFADGGGGRGDTKLVTFCGRH